MKGNLVFCFLTYLFDDNYHVEHVLNEIPIKIIIIQNKKIKSKTYYQSSWFNNNTIKRHIRINLRLYLQYLTKSEEYILLHRKINRRL